MATHALRPDAELILTQYIRGRLAGTKWAGSLVSNRLPRQAGTESAPATDFAIIVRHDGGPSLGPPTYSAGFGVRVFGPDGDESGISTGELARHLIAWLQASPAPGTPIAACRATHGPMRVPQTVGRPEAYLTCELILVGEPINI